MKTKTKAKSKPKGKRSKSAVTGKYVKKYVATASPTTHIVEVAGPNFKTLVKQACLIIMGIEGRSDLDLMTGMEARDWLYRAERALKK